MPASQKAAHLLSKCLFTSSSACCSPFCGRGVRPDSSEFGRFGPSAVACGVIDTSPSKAACATAGFGQAKRPAPLFPPRLDPEAEEGQDRASEGAGGSPAIAFGTPAFGARSSTAKIPAGDFRFGAPVFGMFPMAGRNRNRAIPTTALQCGGAESSRWHPVPKRCVRQCKKYLSVTFAGKICVKLKRC